MKQTLPSQLRLAADIEQAKLDGKPPINWEYRPRHAAPWIQGDTGMRINYCIAYDYEIRLKPLTFPDPPEGRSWWNPSYQSPEWFEVNDGWRPLLTGERAESGDHARFIGRHDSWHSQAAGGAANADTLAWRTKRPLPSPTPARVPLTAADVPPGSCFQAKSSQSYGLMLGINAKGIFLVNSECAIRHHDWDSLMCSGSKILRPGQDWTECSKPAE